MKKIAIVLMTLLFCATAQAGAWGSGSFENDDALDWVAECIAIPGSAHVKATLEAAVKASYLDASGGANAVAAAEVVASALGRGNRAAPDDVREWVKRQQAAQLVSLAPLARQAMAKVRNAKSSELAQLWNEGKPNMTWTAQISDLELRLIK